MKTNKIILAALLLVSISSCKVMQHTSRHIQIEKNPVTVPEQAAKVNVDYSHKVSATSHYQTTRRQAMKEAEYLCLQDSGVDVLIDPIFQIQYHPGRAFKCFQASVTAFAGKYEVEAARVDYTKRYTREEIENYKLFSDPNFARYFYTHGMGDRYYFGPNTEAAPGSENQSKSVVIEATDNEENFDAHKYAFHYYKSVRDAGISIFSIGLAAVGFGIPCLTSLEETEAGVGLLIGGGALLLSGIPMWAVGAEKMKSIKKDVSIRVGATSQGVGLGITF